MPEQGPATTDGVRRLFDVSADDEILLEASCAAANAFVRDLPIAKRHDAASDVEQAWPANVSLGADMLAGRIFRRRNSPAGVETLGDLGPLYVSRSDPDITMLLQLRRPAVG